MFWAHLSVWSTLHVTKVSLLIVGSQWQTALHQFVGWPITSCGKFYPAAAFCTEVAAKLITRTGRCVHIMPVLRQLHWLPSRRRVDFKLAVLTYMALHEYLKHSKANGTYLRTVCCWQKSVDVCNRLMHGCVVPWTRTQFGNRSFTVVGLRVRYSLSASLRDTNSIYSFRKQLKTHLFSGGCRA